MNTRWKLCGNWVNGEEIVCKLYVLFGGGVGVGIPRVMFRGFQSSIIDCSISKY